MSDRIAYEPTDVNPRLLAAIAAGLLTVLVASPLVLALIYPAAVTRPAPLRQPPSPGPRLQLAPAADLAALRARQEARLDGYGWVDRDHNIVHIPIGEAMRRLAAQGIADWPKDAR